MKRETIYKALAIVISCSLLAACGIVAKVSARNDMEESKAAYKVCLAQHPNDVSACEAARLVYEADMQAYRATSTGVWPATPAL